jgi:hypothetical protein
VFRHEFDFLAPCKGTRIVPIFSEMKSFGACRRRCFHNFLIKLDRITRQLLKVFWDPLKLAFDAIATVEVIHAFFGWEFE